MAIFNRTIEIKTTTGINIHNITPHIQDLITANPIQNGQALIFSRHTTTALAINEYEVGRYVLLRLDTAISKGDRTYNFPNISVEHVLPQTPPTNSDWVRDFPTQKERDKYIHRLGNLVLLSRRKNSQAKNYDFDKKKKTYFTTDKGISSPFVLTTQVLREEEWTPAVIERRQKQLIDVLKQVWHLN